MPENRDPSHEEGSGSQGHDRRDFFKRLPAAVGGFAALVQGKEALGQNRNERDEKYYEGLPEEIVQTIKKTEALIEPLKVARAQASDKFYDLVNALQQKKKDISAIKKAYEEYTSALLKHEQASEEVGKAYDNIRPLYTKASAIHRAAIQGWSDEVSPIIRRQRYGLDLLQRNHQYGDYTYHEKIENQAKKILGIK